MDQQLDCALDLMRRLPPAKIEENLANLIDLVPDLTEDLLSAIDQPLKIARCKATSKEYLLCDYNRDGDSFRSPWSNKYDPPLPDGAVPSPKLRKLEVLANEAFDVYRDMYYGGGYSSVYMWDLDDAFAATVLIKKVNDDSNKVKGSWDSIHVVEVHEKSSTDGSRAANYKLTSTIMLTMVTGKPALGKMMLGGSVTRQIECTLPLDDHHTNHSHITNLGRLVEDMENKLRNTLQEVYFGKTKDIVNDLRSPNSLREIAKQGLLTKELAGKLASTTSMASMRASNRRLSSQPTSPTSPTSPTKESGDM